LATDRNSAAGPC
jgi:hypothetical protein